MKELRKIKNPWLHKPGYDCICCSPANPIGLHLEFWEDGEVCSKATLTYFCASKQKAEEEIGFTGCELEETDYHKFRREQMEQFEDDITEGRCYPEMPEGQFIRSK